MTNAAKDKGDRAERHFVDHVAPWWPNARRGKAGGEADLGDIFNISDRHGDDWTVQVADRDIMARQHGKVIAKAREAAQQSERAGTPMWCLVVKRAGCGPTMVGDWFVWLPVWAVVDTNGDGMWTRAAEDDLVCLTVRTWVAMFAPEAF